VNVIVYSCKLFYVLYSLGKKNNQKEKKNADIKLEVGMSVAVDSICKQ